MVDISIVSGTFNRLSYLKNMIQSIRQSLSSSYGLTYEIVLADGGSTDNTIEWCQSQSDIKLIEHGKLLGAVKAFNDAAYAAAGNYVILANDDIEFIEDSIVLAWIHMQHNRQCGIGCFYQDRDRQHLDWNDKNRWHVETMPVVKGRKQATHYYGQVCIVPKWLGDLVGWWSRDEDFKDNLKAKDYQNVNKGISMPGLHTYGGDNELSAKVLDLGFRIQPVAGAKITDKVADDQLRVINNISGHDDPKSAKGHHRDSWMWGRRWLNRNEKLGYRNLAGPIIKDKITIPNQNEAMVHKERILYLPIYEQGWPVLKEQKRGLREALSKIAFVIEYDYMGANKSTMMTELISICHKIVPTIVLTQLHNGDVINPVNVQELRDNCLPNTRFINWNGDYWPKQLLDDNGLTLARSFDLMTTVNREVIEKHQSMGINTQYWQIGFEPEGVEYEPEVYHDIVFLASGYSPKRQELGQFLKSLSGNINLGLYGSGWPKNWAKGENLYNFKEACKIYRGAKIAIGDSQWPESGFVSNRIFQILAAGNCVLCHQWFRGMEELGLIDGVNCIIWRDYNDLRTKIIDCLSDNIRREQIAMAGEQLALNRHSFDTRVQELFNLLNIGQVAEEGEHWRW